MRLKILSLWQPHATLCVTASKENPEVPAKPIETRSWRMYHRGWLGMHSAMKKDPEYKALCSQPWFAKYIPDFEKLPFGYILGMVNISDCFPTEHDPRLKGVAMKIARDKADRLNEILAFGDFSENRFGSVISDFVKFTTPIKATGRQGFWFHEMPNMIGERVHLWDGHLGTILDYNEDQQPYKYLISHDTLIGGRKRHWYDVNGQFKII